MLADLIVGAAFDAGSRRAALVRCLAVWELRDVLVLAFPICATKPNGDVGHHKVVRQTLLRHAVKAVHLASGERPMA
jgi:hypothetical protein